jgi:hypothetical protein
MELAQVPGSPVIMVGISRPFDEIFADRVETLLDAFQAPNPPSNSGQPAAPLSGST